MRLTNQTKVSFVLSLSNILGRSRTKEFSIPARDFAYVIHVRKNIKYWMGQKCNYRAKNFEVQYVKSEVENCHFVTFHFGNVSNLHGN